MEKRNVLVLGATGNQGGAVVQALLRDGHHVTGVTRNVASPKSQQLIIQGVQMIAADFLDKDALSALMKDVHTVFAMTTPGWEGDVASEILQGTNMVEAAKKANVPHFIYTSVSDANQDTGIPHFDSKYEIEKQLVASGINYTIVAPTYFMDNIFQPYVFDAVKKEGVLKIAMPENTKLQQISAEDIGKFVAVVVNQREKMFGQRIDIAGDAISGNDVAEVLTMVLGKKVTYEGFSPDYLRAQSEDMANMFDWFNNTGYSADLDSLKQYKLSSFKTWAKKQDWSVLTSN
ncbi:MAG: nucleoside-diphosphate sugar epimerase [Flavobacteriaceae bacterium]|nr:MAG: nucleoside-diphosphate sugar epimerase [Flavobacteriaceae bacterium]